MLNVLRYSVVFMFLGRAYEHIRWIGPYRDFFYNPIGFGKWYAEWIGKDLADIYKDPFYEHFVSALSIAIGVVFVLAAFCVLFYEKIPQFKWVIYLGVFFLVTTFMGYFMAKHFLMWGMLFEHSCQLVTPLVFIWYTQGQKKRIIWVSVWAIALTFYGHGLFAMGYYPQPGKFVDMTIASTGFTEDFVRYFLIVIGYIDIVVAIVLLIPFLDFKGNLLRFVWVRFLVFVTIIYCILWGFLTSVARLYYSFNAKMLQHWADQYWYEFLVRIPHFIIPILLLYLIRKQYKKA